LIKSANFVKIFTHFFHFHFRFLRRWPENINKSIREKAQKTKKNEYFPNFLGGNIFDDFFPSRIDILVSNLFPNALPNVSVQRNSMSLNEQTSESK